MMSDGSLDDIAGKKPRATIRTVALDAGVSSSAVSKVLRNAYGVSEELRAKVMVSVERVGYRPNFAARTMRGRSYTLGILVTDMLNPFFSELVAGINAALAGTPYQSLIGVSNSAVGVEQALIDSMIDRGMDGLIFIAPSMEQTHLEEIGTLINTVVIGHYQPSARNFDTVNNDDQKGAEIAVRHLVDHGHKRISHLNNSYVIDPSVSVASHRDVGYRNTMTRLGLADQIEVALCEHSPKAREVAREVLQREDRPTALFCWTDANAMEALGAAMELGIKVPEELSIVGYDNSPMCDLAPINLTTIDQSGTLMGQIAGEILLERIEGRRNSKHLTIEPKLKIRGTTGPATRQIL